MNVRERLDGTAIVTDTGDVLPSADLPPEEQSIRGNESRIAQMRPEDPGIVRYYKIQDTRATADFSTRNKHLLALAQEVGKMKRHQGAAMLVSEEVDLPYYRDIPHIERLAAKAQQVAVDLGGAACASCPLAEYCPTTYAKLEEDLSDPRTRSRFKNRVGKSANNQFCEQNLDNRKLNMK